MLWYKLEPAHVHLQIQGILRISRTVQWFREAAQQDSTHLRRILEEIGHTPIYVATFVYWMKDTSEHQQRTREFLANRLHDAQNCATRLWHQSSPAQID
jgi:ubiquinone biosynthesis protein COQ9